MLKGKKHIADSDFHILIHRNGSPMQRAGNDVLQRTARPGSPPSRVPSHELIRPTIVQLVFFVLLLLFSFEPVEIE